MRRPASPGSRFARAFLFAAGAAGLGTAFPQSALYSVSVPVEIEHDSNPNMTSGPSAGANWLRVSPKLTATYVRGGDEYEGEAALTAEKSSNHDVASDRLDPRLRGAWKHLGERDTVRLALEFDRRSFRTLDVSEQLPVGVDGARTMVALTGGWQRALDARTSGSVDVRQEWDRYSGTSTPAFRRTIGTLRLTREKDERTTWYTAVNGQDYRSDPVETSPGVDARTHASVFGALLGATYALTPALRVDASAGPMHFSQAGSGNSWQAALKAEYAAERWNGAVEASRTPGVNSAAGGLVAVNDVRARLRYDINALARLEAAIARSSDRTAHTNRSVASAAWLYQWSRWWEVGVRASARWLDGPGGSARGNRISVLLVYSGIDL